MVQPPTTSRSAHGGQVSGAAASGTHGSGGEPGGGPVPEARAFHSAAVVERRMYVFGGHVLSFDSDQNKKRRRFFNDVWCLDTVRVHGCTM